MQDIDQALAEYGLDRVMYERCLKDISDKIDGVNDMDWGEIVEKYNLPITKDTLRKASSQEIFGNKFVIDYLQQKQEITNVDEKLEQLRREKIKIQTLNVERNRLDRAQARQELFWEHVGSLCQTLPLPDFKPLFETNRKSTMEYICCLADLHVGADFQSENNVYSTDIFMERLRNLSNKLYNFIQDKQLSHINILCLGDCIQNILRISDLKINDTSVVKSIVFVSRILAQFLNQLSEHVNIDYYHTPSSNHSQYRALGAKSNELMDEDFEYVISHYISDLCSQNPRIKVHLQEDNIHYIRVNVFDYDIYAMHGHQIKNLENSLRDLTLLTGNNVDYLILGHFHASQIISVNEYGNSQKEILVANAFCGSDPYADILMKGSKAAVDVYGFDEFYGRTEAYKFILN